MLSVAVAALHERDPEHLWPLVAEVLPGVCGGGSLVYKLDDWDERQGTVGASPGVAAEVERLGGEGMGVLRAGYPFAGHYAARRDRAPVTARQVAGRAWSGSRTARLLGEALDADHILGIPVPGSRAPVTGCMVHRSGVDFTEDHIRIAGRLQPLLAAVEEQRQLLRRLRTGRSPAGAAPEAVAADCALTPRETAVLLLLTDALTATAMGRRLGISDRTVHKHVENIYRKLGTRDRISTVLRAQQLGLVPTPVHAVALVTPQGAP
ncbi:helix-turn-helix transcriptional regulator [Streptomyces sp. YIM S03343]